MSFCQRKGKDTIVFVTKEDHQQPSKVQISDPEPAPGLILPDGSINWNCPCLGGMATGPCGMDFREAFTCFHYSKADPKGSDCFAVFSQMQDCMTRYPTVYNKGEDDEEDFPSMGDGDKSISNDTNGTKGITDNSSDKTVDKKE